MLAGVAAAPAFTQAAPDRSLTAPDGTSVTIERDDWGVPRILAETEAAAFYAQGFAAAEDRLFQMETFWRAATGRLAELTGADGVEADMAIRTVFYTTSEREAQFDALPEHIRELVSNYVAGINAYIALARSTSSLLPAEYGLPPLSSIGIEDWDVDRAVAVMQFFARLFGAWGGQELERLAELQTHGSEWFEENRPINDPSAPTTLQDGPAVAVREAMYRGPTVREEVIESMVARRERVDAALRRNGIPEKFGSYAAVVAGARSESGFGMLLGAPQMAEPRVTGVGAVDRNVTWESEIVVGDPDSPDLHIAGISVPGLPGVIIGRTPHYAWSITSGVSDNVDTYVITTVDTTFSGYVYDGATRAFGETEETIEVRGGDPVSFQRRRTIHGPVFLADLANRQAFAYRYAFWEQELDLLSALYDLWKATSVGAIDAAVSRFPVSFNYLYLHRDQTIGFYHLGNYPIRPEDADPRLPLMGDGSQEWERMRTFSELPQGTNPASGYYVNWNNKPASWWDHGDITVWTEASGQRAYDGVIELDAFLAASPSMSFGDLRQLNRLVAEHDRYTEYPGSYQQVVQLGEAFSRGENLVPPGQSAFFRLSQFSILPSPHTSDQWELYESFGMKAFTFTGETPVSNRSGPELPFAPHFEAIFPNPATGPTVRASYSVPGPGTVNIDVIDLLGRTVVRWTGEQTAAGPQTVVLPVEGLSSGVYLVRFQVGGFVQSRKVVVVR
ncbi:MAG: penicillin acylase family protein [Rhodothermales bacterium]